MSKMKSRLGWVGLTLLGLAGGVAWSYRAEIVHSITGAFTRESTTAADPAMLKLAEQLETFAKQAKEVERKLAELRPPATSPAARAERAKTAEELKRRIEELEELAEDLRTAALASSADAK